MLLHQLIHPTLNAALGGAGHHSKILIADGNYPASSTLGPRAQLVHLNLRPGLLTVSQVFETLLTAVPIDIVNTMGIPPDDPYAQDDPPVWADYRRILKEAGSNLDLKPIDKWDFYEAVRGPDTVLSIQTGDQALWANLLLSIGVRQPEA